MSETHYIKFEPRILKQIGDELVESGYDSINELVRNAYDAGASYCKIKLIDNIKKVFDSVYDMKEFEINGKGILIEDDGKGMSKNELINGFLTVGTTIKYEEKQQLKEGERVPVGEKGIGRFSCQKLGRKLILETESKVGERNIATFNWDKITSSQDIAKIPVEITELEAVGKPYTRLWICDLTEDFRYFISYQEETEQLSFLESTFNFEIVKNLEVSLSHIVFSFEAISSDFEISIEYKNVTRQISSSAKFLDFAETTHSFELTINDENELVLIANMELRPWYLENVHDRLLGKYNANKYKKRHSFFKKCLNELTPKLENSLSLFMSQDEIIDEIFDGNYDRANELKKLVPIKSKIYSYKRRSDLLLVAIESAYENNRVNHEINKNKEELKQKVNTVDLREFLEHHNGVKLFRNATRVGRIGAKDDDWLQLQQLRTKGQQFYRFEYGNLVGYIQLNDAKQLFIRDVSSRTKLLENESSASLISLSQYIFAKPYYDFTRFAYTIVKDYFNDNEILESTSIEEVSKKNDTVIEQIEELSKSFESLSNLGIDNEIDLLNFQNQIVDIKNNFKEVIGSVKETKKLTKDLVDEQLRIAAEAYNNYKLMANGLITETITHEMHSILTSDDNTSYKDELDIIRDTLFDHNEISILKNNFAKLEKGYDSLYSTVFDMKGLYEFLEKTFILEEAKIQFEESSLDEFSTRLSERFEKRFKKNNIRFISNINGYWELPKGSLVHVFYNLIDNSIYWINEKKVRNKKTNIDELDQNEIHIKMINQNTIQYYDTGLGVIKKMEDVLFGPLVSGKKKNGRGMGMYIVKELLKSVNADIILLSERNEYGNRYIFEINIEGKSK